MAAGDDRMAAQGRMFGVSLALALCCAGCGQSDRAVTVLECRSADASPITAQVTINKAANHQIAIIVKYPSTKPVSFQVMGESPAYYSATETDTANSDQPASLYYDVTSGTVVETFPTSTASREVRLKRCEGKIDAKACKAALASLVQGPARDLEDCDNPAPAECESWRMGSRITSEIRLSCVQPVGR